MHLCICQTKEYADGSAWIVIINGQDLDGKRIPRQVRPARLSSRFNYHASPPCNVEGAEFLMPGDFWIPNDYEVGFLTFGKVSGSNGSTCTAFRTREEAEAWSPEPSP